MLFVTRGKREEGLRQSSDFVHLFFNRDAGLQVLELDRAARFRKNREGVRIPLDHGLAERYRLAVFDFEARAVHDVVPFLFAVLFVHNRDQAGAVHGYDRLVAALNHVQVDELHEAVVARFDFRLFGDASRRAADVERAHRQLRAGFADGLRRDHSHSFAHLHESAGGQVSAVAPSANTAAGFAGQHRANFHPLDARRLNSVREFLGNFLVDLDDHAAFVVFDLFERYAANDAVAQRLDFDSGFENRLNVNSVSRATIELIDDDVLRHVHQTPREVTGIGGLERRIGQTFSGAVRGNEVLQHCEAFAEVRSDRSLDNLARRLGHQAAHSGKLPDLLFRSARAGIGHHVHRVDQALLVFFFEGLEHFVRDFFSHVRPDGDYFVVAFAVGDRTVKILLLHFHYFVFRGVHQLEFHARDNHVADADGDARLRRIQEAEFLELIQHYDRLLESKSQVTILHHCLDALFLQQAVDERHLAGQVIVEDYAAHSGVQELAI